MNIRLILPALALGGVLLASPAAWAKHGSGDDSQPAQSAATNQTWTQHDRGSRADFGEARSHQQNNNNANGGNGWPKSFTQRFNAENKNGGGQPVKNSNPWFNNSNNHNNAADNRRHDRNHNTLVRDHRNNNIVIRDRSRIEWARTHNRNGHWTPSRGTRHTVNRAWFRFSSHDFRHFNRWEQDRWRHGHWRHGFHHGRNGWWWYLNGGWFFYNAPIYPYPGYVSNDAFYDDYYYDGSDGYGEDDYDDYSGQPRSDGYWYYCRNPQGYYPDVRTCRSDWQKVSPRDRQNYDDDDNGPSDDQYDDQGPRDDQGGDDDGPDNGDDN